MIKITAESLRNFLMNDDSALPVLGGITCGIKDIRNGHAALLSKTQDYMTYVRKHAGNVDVDYYHAIGHLILYAAADGLLADEQYQPGADTLFCDFIESLFAAQAPVQTLISFLCRYMGASLVVGDEVAPAAGDNTSGSGSSSEYVDVGPFAALLEGKW